MARQVERDRPVLEAEIEVTEEMARAGAEVFGELF